MKKLSQKNIENFNPKNEEVFRTNNGDFDKSVDGFNTAMSAHKIVKFSKEELEEIASNRYIYELDEFDSNLESLLDFIFYPEENDEDAFNETITACHSNFLFMLSGINYYNFIPLQLIREDLEPLITNALNNLQSYQNKEEKNYKMIELLLDEMETYVRFRSARKTAQIVKRSKRKKTD